MQIAYTYQDGEKVKRGSIELPPSSRTDFKSCYIFAFAKSGSVLVNEIAAALMAECGVAVVDLPSHLHLAGIDFSNWQSDFTQLFPSHGYCFKGFRGLPISMLGAEPIKRARKILVVRDPRDMLVSHYFSVKLSHNLDVPRGTQQFEALVDHLKLDSQNSIDDYCLTYAWTLNAAMLSYSNALDGPDTLVLRYEDFIYDKVGLARSIRDFFALDVSDDRLPALVAPFDQVPQADRPTQHVRQVHPGDHRRKLKPETVALLDGILVRFLKTFNYTPSVPAGEDKGSAQLKAHAAQIVELQQELGRLQSHIGEVSAERDALMSQIINANAYVGTLTAERDALAAHTAERERLLREAEVHREAQQKVTLEQKAQLARLRREIDDLKVQGREMDGRLQKLSGDLAEVGRSRWVRLGARLGLAKLRALSSE